MARQPSVEESGPGFVILDVLLYRPVGLAVTIIGTGLFVGMSPLTALASIPEPHDAFAKTSKILVLAPAAYTFIRPLGDRSAPYHVPPYKRKPVAAPIKVQANKPAVAANPQPINPAIPAVQPPLQSPSAGM